jgi:hypothetical protein
MCFVDPRKVRFEVMSSSVTSIFRIEEKAKKETSMKQVASRR